MIPPSLRPRLHGWFSAGALLSGALGSLFALLAILPAQAQVNVTDIRPNSATSDTPVRIYGTGFSATAADNTVTFGETTATVDAASNTALTVLVPAGPSGPVDVSVSTPDGSDTAPEKFTVVTQNTISFTDVGGNLPPVVAGTSHWADFDDDGHQDLLITGLDTTDTPIARVYLGDGFGNFTQANAGLTGVYRSAAEVGDVNNDGNLDVVIAGEDASANRTATLYLGDGTGNFTEAGAGLTGVGQGSAELGDLNNDGDLDIILTGMNTSDEPSVSVYLGDGTGGFTSEEDGDLIGVTTSSSALGDMNNDGILDLIVTGENMNGNPSTTVYQGDGTGGFAVASTTLFGVRFGASAFADVDEDDNLDVVLTGRSTDNIGVSLVYLGNGDGTFTEANAGLTGLDHGSLSVGDLDGDGFLDLLLTGIDADGVETAFTYLGDGTGAFTQANEGLTGVADASSDLGDFDRDGSLDLIVTGVDMNGTRTSTLYRNGPSPPLHVTTLEPRRGASGIPVRIYGTGFTPNAGDHTVEFGGTTATVDSAQSNVLYAQVPTGVTGPVPVSVSVGDTTMTVAERFIAAGPGGADFTDVGATLTGVDSSSTAWGDYNGDGDPDVLITGIDGSGTVITQLFRNEGDETFSQIDAGLTAAKGQAAWGDYNQDGRLDLAIVGRNNTGTATATIYRNDGGGSFTPISTGLLGVTNGSVAWGDHNQDGLLDLTVTGEDSGGLRSTTIYRNEGEGSFTEVGAGLVGVAEGDVAWGDYNQDGLLDLALIGTNSDNLPVTTIYQNEGSGLFSPISTGIADVSSGSIAWGDYDHDGALDLAVAGADQSSVPQTTIYRNDGNGTFTDISAGLTGIRSGAVAWGDHDGDGLLDLAVTGDTTGTADAQNGLVAIYRNEDNDTFSRVGPSLPAAKNGSIAWTDHNRDGALDLFVTGLADDSTKTATLFRNEATAVAPEISVQPPSLGETLSFGGAASASIEIENSATDLDALDLEFEAYVVSPLASTTSSSSDPPLSVRKSTDWPSASNIKAGTASSLSSTEPKTHAGTPSVIIDDAVGDADSSDVDRVRAAIANDRLNLVLEHPTPIDTSTYQAVLLLDVDQDSTTGTAPDYVLPEQEIGAEYQVIVDVANDAGASLVNLESNEFLAQSTVDVDSSAVHVSVPLTAISASSPFNVIGVAGTPTGPHDWYPHVGAATVVGTEWLSLSSATGLLAPGETQSVDVTMDASGLPPGDQEAVVRITNTDPDQETVDVPVSITVDPPSVTLSNADDSPSPGSGPASVDLSLPDSFTPTSGTLYYRPVGARAFDSTAIDLSTLDPGAAETVSAEIPETAITETGVQYYVQLHGPLPDGNGRLSLDVPSDAPISTAYLPVQLGRVAAQGTFEPQRYRMLSVPLGLGERSVVDVLEEQYGTYDPGSWRFARWAPADSSYRFGRDLGSLQPGEAAWLITAGGDSLAVEDAQSVDASGPHTVPIEPGWNQIASPFAFPVAWASVRRPESVRAPVAYDASRPQGDRYQYEADVLQPWRGAFVYNQADTSVSVQIPPVRASEAPASEETRRAKASNEYRLRAIATAFWDGEQLQDRATWLGFSEGAEAGFGPKDLAKPPTMGPHVRLHATTDDGPALARSLKPPSSEGAAWDLVVGLSLNERLQSAKEVTVQLAEQGRRPDGFERYVVDVERGRLLPVTNQSVSVKLTENQPTRRLRVIVGTESFAKQHSEGASLTVDETKLRANAPNPFSTSTTIPYQLAEDSEVTITIYDVLGRRVQNLVSGTKRAGVHQVEWNPQESGNSSLASGIYFCRMEAGEHTSTQKLVLVR